MAVFETFLGQLIRGELDSSEISTTLNRLINEDPTLIDNVESLVQQYNAAHPAAPVPDNFVEYLLGEITRIHTATGQGINTPPDAELEKTTILGEGVNTPSDAELEKTTVLGEDFALPADEEATVANPDVADATVATSAPGAESTPDASSSTGTFVDVTSTSADHMMINVGEQEQYEVDVGSTISGRYHIIEKLGEGGMGLVFKARDELMAMAEDRNPYVAVKVLTKAFRQRRDAFIALQRETSKAQRLAHPNICTVFHFDKDGETIFMTMELLNGVDLRDYITKHIKKPGKGYSMEKAWPFIKGTADALQYAHKNNLIHSDLKPGNVYVVQNEKTGQETVKVIDFGIAQAIKPRDEHAGEGEGEGDGEVTKFDPKKLGALTPSYATVEMFDGLSPVQSDDIYALGCISYEMLTGSRPYGRLTAKKAQQRGVKMPTVSLKNLGLTRRQEKGLLKSVRLFRKDRTATIDEFLHDVAPRKSYTWQIAAGVVGTVILIGLLSAQNISAFFQNRYNEEVSLKINSVDMSVFTLAIDELLLYENLEERTKVANASRVVIQDNIAGLCASSFSPADQRYDYQSALQWLNKGLELFPDSSTLVGLRQQMRRELNQENSILGTILSDALKKRRLLTSQDPPGAVDVLKRAKAMDPGNTLLSDPSLRFVFKEAAEKAIKKQSFDAAGKLIEHSREYIADASTMPLYMADNLTIAKNTKVRAKLVNKIGSGLLKADSTSLEQQSNAGMGRQMAVLRQLDSDNRYLARAQTNNDQRFNQDLPKASTAQGQMAFERYAPLLSVENLYQQRLRFLSSKSGDSSVYGSEFSARFNQSSKEFFAQVAKFADMSLDHEQMSALDLFARRVMAEAPSAQQLQEFAANYAQSLSGNIDERIKQNRYPLSRIQVEQAQAMLPRSLARPFSDINARIAREMASFITQESRERSLAQVESIRQNLTRQLKAKNISQAKKIEKELVSLMDPTDPFLTDELPDLYIEALYDLSIEAIELGKPSQARAHFRDMGRYSDKKDPRYIRINNLLQGETLKARLLAQVRRSTVLYEQDLRQKTSELRRLNAWDFETFFEDLVEEIIKRAERLATNSRDRALAMIKSARPVFPNSERMKNYQLGEEPSSDAGAIGSEGSAGAALSDETRKALAEASKGASADKKSDKRLGQLIASVESNLNKRQLNATFRILQTAYKDFPDDKRIKALDKAYRTERSKAEDIYRKHNSAVLRGDFAKAAKLIEQAIGSWRDNPEFKQAQQNMSKIQAQVAAGARVCSDNLSGKGRNPRAFCHDVINKKRGPRLVIIPGDKGLLSSFVMTRNEITISDYNLYCKATRKCRAKKGKTKRPMTGLSAKEMEAYAKWLSDNSLYTYRLPALKEWMYATTANNKEENNDYNCTLRAGGHQVKGHEIQNASVGAPNRWGLVNYVGNVDEVVRDGDKYVLKGGNHKDPMFQCTTNLKKKYDGKAQALVGFRLIRSLH